MSEPLSPVVPGPCPCEGCPPPSEIDCVEVTKVYDLCFQTDTRENVCLNIPAHCGRVPEGTTASGVVSTVGCSVQAIVPIANSGGFANVTLLVTVTLAITLTTASGHVLCTFTASFSFFKTVTLCAPSGVTVGCSSPASAVGPSVIVDCDVCSVVSICLLIQSSATVKILIPTYGFCLPAPCVVSPSPPFSCPPSPLFPSQCVVTPPTPTPCMPGGGPEWPVGGPMGGT